ncbi:flagellar export protein FliJ [Sneathiella limimaris]|uniref:flagellar export protein FliJ n=1 Tax=Sneathiella limimaris TaxID=1964213 RepID=UPI00146EE5E6|nr:flagellar export protein FliJ [Sneathiella limimaris]
MAGIGNLIRVQKFKVDEKRREVSDLEELRANFVAQLEKLNQEQVREQEIASGDSTAALHYASYAEGARLRRENLQASIQELDSRIEQARSEMAELFQELKKYEISEENRLRLLKEQQEKRYQEEMDSFSIEMYRRKSIS